MKNSIGTFTYLLTVSLVISFSPLQLQAQQQSVKHFEISGGFSFAKLHANDQAFDTAGPIGLSLEAGYRPAILGSKLMLGAYGFNLPGENTVSPEPTIRGAGLKISYMLLNWQRRINPYLSFAGGLYQVDVPPQPVCVQGPCDIGLDLSSGTTESLSPGAGLYVRLSNSFVFRADASVFFPFQSEDLQNSRQRRWMYTGGLSFRF